MNRTARFAVIERYLAALQQLGDLRVGGKPLRDVLRLDALDLWMASDTRESNLWRDMTLPHQIRALIDDESQHAHVSRDAARRLQWPVGGTRVVAAWLRALLHSLRRCPRPSLGADVVFVQYWPTPPRGTPRPTAQTWRSPYFGSLPERLSDAGVSVGFLQLHADGPASAAPRVVRDAVRQTSSTGTRHALVADALTPGRCLRALRSWWNVARRLPSDAELSSHIPEGSDVAALWPWWKASLRRSVRGSHGVRAALLTEMFGAVVQANVSTKLWVVAFEGQGWESCLARQLDAAGCRWLPYVHTMMRPWDLRARTFLREYPVPQLAVHGRHDHAELEMLGTPLVEVEALRYQHLAVPSSHAASRDAYDESTWLIVGGGDCERSAAELHELLTSMRRSAVTRHLVARWHPQCTAPTDVTLGNVRFTTEPLHELVKQVDAAFMVGRAGPLDTYLAGVPSCSLRDESGLAMSPIEENSLHHTATDAYDAVNWMLAAEKQRGFTASTENYFVIDEQLPRWMALVKKLMS